MVQKEVSVNCVVAWVCWALAIVGAGASLVLPHLHIAAPIVLLVGGAVTLHIRGFFHTFEERDRQVFELGRETGMRSVR